MSNFFARTYRNLNEKGILQRFIILVSFDITFILARVVTHLQRAGILPDQTGPNHIHHLVPGIILILIGGYLGLAFWANRKTGILASLLFGIGAALTLDEFALWLNLKDVYWEDAGRRSIDAVVIASGALLAVFALSEAHDHNWGPFKKSKLG